MAFRSLLEQSRGSSALVLSSQGFAQLSPPGSFSGPPTGACAAAAGLHLRERTQGGGHRRIPRLLPLEPEGLEGGIPGIPT